jgi:hypothetical protein
MNQKKFQMEEAADRMAGRGVAERAARDADGVLNM